MSGFLQSYRCLPGCRLLPRLTPQVLQQEGWHLDLEAPDRPMVYKGVVYNEMKGRLLVCRPGPG